MCHRGVKDARAVSSIYEKIDSNHFASRFVPTFTSYSTCCVPVRFHVCQFHFIISSPCHQTVIIIIFHLDHSLPFGNHHIRRPSIRRISNEASHEIECSSSYKTRTLFRQSRNVYGTKRRLSRAVHTCGPRCSMLMPMMIFQSVRILLIWVNA